MDPQLYKNLLFLKHYEGDCEDLGLYFAINQHVFGTVESKEIKPGGNSIAVTNENKYEYIHTMSDYKCTIVIYTSPSIFFKNNNLCI